MTTDEYAFAIKSQWDLPRKYNFLMNAYIYTCLYACRINFRKALTSDYFETPDTHVFSGADYEYDSENSRKFYCRGENVYSIHLHSLRNS